MHAIRNTDGHYYQGRRDDVALWTPQRSAARWMNKTTARRMATILRSKENTVRIVSIND